MAKRKIATKTKKAISSIVLAASMLLALTACAELNALAPALRSQEVSSTTQELADAKLAAVKVHSIDVGQGDATLFEVNGAFALVDTGDKKAKKQLVDYLHSAGVESLEYLAVTHPHADHIANVTSLIEEFEIKKILLPQFEKAPLSTTATFEKMLDAIDSANIPVHMMMVGNEFQLNGAILSVLADGVESSEQNDVSPMIKFSDNNFSFILSGDAESKVEYAAIRNGIYLKADVFKAAHHGSRYSNTEEFVAAVSPAYVVISCGKGNSYKHPHEEALNSFAKVNAKVFQTSKVGNIIFYKNDANELCVAVQKEE